MDPVDRVEQAPRAEQAEGEGPGIDKLDLGLDDVERENDLATLARVEFELAEVEQAMRRIEEGSYGLCEACRSPIEGDLIEARPTARLCRADQQASEA